MTKFLPHYPDIKVEITVHEDVLLLHQHAVGDQRSQHIHFGLTDIATQRYDGGVRIGERVAKDMIAMRIGPDMRMAVVGAPSYFAKRAPPKKPQQLAQHNCINMRLPTYGGLFPWKFEKGDRELKLRVDGQLVFNNVFPRLDAALAGLDLAYLPEDLVQPYLSDGRLTRALNDWCRRFAGYHLYYPGGRQPHRPSPWSLTYCDIEAENRYATCRSDNLLRSSP